MSWNYEDLRFKSKIIRKSSEGHSLLDHKSVELEICDRIFYVDEMILLMSDRKALQNRVISAITELTCSMFGNKFSK